MKRLVSTLTLAAVLFFGTSQSFGSVIVSGVAQPAQCQKTSVIVSGLPSVIVSGLASVIVSGLTSVIVSGFVNNNSCQDQSISVIVSG